MNARGPYDPIEPEASGSRPGVGLDQALAGLRVSGPGTRGGLDRFRLGHAAAGALRAALEGLSGDDMQTPLQVMADETALEVRCSRVDPDMLGIAGGVLETVEGNLAPTPGVPGSWSVRLPLLAPRETFLMIERGGVPIALPWHAVTRVRMITRAALTETAAREGIAVVSPLGLEAPDDGERPAVMVGLGLRRAYVLADRLVWRMAAEPLEPPIAPPDPRLGPALRAGGDDVYWMMDPAELLSEVVSPALPFTDVSAFEPAATREATPAPPPREAEERSAGPARSHEEFAAPYPRPALKLITLTAAEVEPLEDESGMFEEEWDEPAAPPITTHEAASAPVAEPEPAPLETPAPLRAIEPAPLEAPAPAQLTEPMPLEAPTPPRAIEPAQVEAPAPAKAIEPAPLEAPTPPKAVEPAPLEAPAPLREIEPAPAPAAFPARRVLVAEDSITAGIFLGRLLEQRGCNVRTVATARELRTCVVSERWDLVFADVDLPDAHEASAMSRLAPRRADGTSAPVVALVRDEEDAALARAVGVRLALRKPFESDDLEQVLAVLGPPPAPFGRR